MRAQSAETGADIGIARVVEVLNRTAYGLVIVVGLFLARPLAVLEMPLTGGAGS